MEVNGLMAIIIGTDRVSAKELAEELVKKDIFVIGVGEDNWWGMEDKIEWRSSVEDIDIRAEYIFDYVGSKTAWEKAKNEGSKLVVIDINNELDFEEIEPTAKLIRFGNVVGKNIKKMEWLWILLKQAAMNKSLVLPEVESVRLMFGKDMVEAILRFTFMGQSGSELEIWGNNWEVSKLARTLIDMAKMTRLATETGIMDIKFPEVEVEKEWQKIGWQPEIELKNGVDEILKEVLVEVDEESRRGLKNKNKSVAVTKVEPKAERIKEKRGYELVVEEELIDAVPKKIEEPKIEMVEKLEEKIEEVIKDEAEIEIKPLINRKEVEGVEIKNSNNRPVVGEVEEEQKETREVGEMMVNWEGNTKNNVPEKKIETKVPLTRRWKRKIKWEWVGLGGSLVIIGWLVMMIFSVTWWWNETKNIATEIKEKKYEKAVLSAKKLENNLNKRAELIDAVGGLGKTGELFKIWRDGVAMMEEVVKLAKNGEKLNGVVLKGDEGNVNELANEMELSADSLVEKSGMIVARLDGGWVGVPAGIKKSLSDFKKQVEEYRELARTGKEVAAILPDIVGGDGKRRDYMVLFQNENELRATGGFIGSYGMLSFEAGKLRNLEINDVYEADGQLKGHVDPPEAIKTFLGEGGWYMRDANYNPDFPSSVKDIKWFLDKETGRSVDGVMGINLAVARAMLEVVGEVSVPDYNTKINANNLYEQAEFYSEKNFFPGSKQKASFLGHLGKQLFEEMKNLDSEKQVKMVTAMLNKLESNDIQISVENKETEKKLAELGWNGAMYEGRCGGSNCFADYVYIVESNFGVNKANYYIYRNVEEVVDIQSKILSRVLRINYENSAKSSNWPGGDYKNYVRIYIPKTANIAEVSVLDNRGGKTVYGEESLSIKDVNGKKEVGLLMTVPIKSKRSVEIRYTDQVDLEVTDKFSYLSYIQRQSGFGDTGWVTLVTMPNGWQALQVQPEASVIGGKLMFNEKLTKDIRMGVELGR